MSRLDSFIRRVTAQRDCLNKAADMLDGVDGPVLELGLGNGRTFDHLRSLFDEQDIFVFDRHVKAHPDCIPDEAHMLLGDFTETLPSALSRLPGKAKLAHCDIGSGDKSASVSLAEKLGAVLPDLLAKGALIVSDQPFDVACWSAIDLPDTVSPGRYHIYRQD
ncbi:class I SAM-dependent methyltransferase [Sneathiella aquimaris]|uniref:class I SAM-dependent methyltransferase n=1 Tax=Sneathiella aquimaris TaxID=2599305 RepID=UPI00146F28D7|nr:class I SAM-dependent methyltransferase [Sneathiella aquimaris]